MKQLHVGMIVLISMCAACAAPGMDDSATAAPAAEAPSEAAAAATPQPMDFGPLEIGTAPEHHYADEQIDRGRALVAFGGCNDCHTPFNVDPATGAPAPDMGRMLSGHPRRAPDPSGIPVGGDLAVIGPSGTSFTLGIGTVYSFNLTPDIETGTGSWTEQMFVDVFRKAKHMGGEGRPVLPPMPWYAVGSLPDDDLVAIFAYLRSIPPIVNAVPPVKVPEEIIGGIAEGNAAVLAQMEAQRR